MVRPLAAFHAVSTNERSPRHAWRQS